MGSVKRWWRRTEPALQQGAVKFDAKARQVAAKLDEHSGMSPDSIAKSRRLEEHLDAKATDWERQLDTTTMALQRRAGERVRRALSSMESAALAGVASGLLLVLSIYLLRRQPGAHDTSPAELTAWFADSTNRRLVLVGLQLAPFSAIGLLWFIAVIRRRLGEREDQFFAVRVPGQRNRFRLPDAGVGSGRRGAHPGRALQQPVEP